MLVLIGLTTVAIAIAVTMTSMTIDSQSLWFEIGKLTAQAGILTGFGAHIPLLIHEIQQDQEFARKGVEAER